MFKVIRRISRNYGIIDLFYGNLILAGIKKYISETKVQNLRKLGTLGYEIHPVFRNPNKNVALLTSYSRKILEQDGPLEII